MTALKSEIVSVDEYYNRIWRLMKQLDTTNIRLLTAVQELGPRNLLEVSRRTRIPFTSVYNRVRKLEAMAGHISHLEPTMSRLGLVSLTVLTNAKPGCEDKVTEALKIPNYWRTVTLCEGGFTHHTRHCVPYQHVKTYQQYLKEAVNKGLASSNTVLLLGDYQPNLLNFKHYDPKKKEWRFRWDAWLKGVAKQHPVKTIEDPADYSMHLDRRDLLLVKEFERDARKTFAELAPLLGITLQAVKYRYDRKLVAQGVVEKFAIDVMRFPLELSAFYDIHLEFPSRIGMNRFYSYLPELFFIVGVAKVLKRDGLVIRVHILESQVANLFEFLSELCKRRALTSYSPVRLRIATKEKQTVSYEQFDDKKGWLLDYDKSLSKLRGLL